MAEGVVDAAAAAVALKVAAAEEAATAALKAAREAGSLPATPAGGARSDFSPSRPGSGQPGRRDYWPRGRWQHPAASPVRDCQASARHWRSLGATRWVLKNLSAGAQIPWLRRPRYHRARAFPMADADKAFAEAEIERCLAKGYWRELFGKETDQQVVIVNGFVVTAAGKKRFVLDCRVPNDYIDPRRFKYESLTELAAQLRPGDELIKWDVRDAYHHLLLREEDRKYFAIQVLGRTFQSLTMPFGLRVAPYLWTKVCRPVVQRLRALGLRDIVYVDDFGGAPPSRRSRPAIKADARRGSLEVQRLFSLLGLQLHPTKGRWEGTMELPLLDHVVDTHRQLFLLMPERTTKVKAMAGRILAEAAHHRRWTRKALLRSFCGAAVSTLLSVPNARFKLRSLYDALVDHKDESGRRVRLGRQATTDLRWWMRLDEHALTGRALWATEPTVTLHTDASSAGWGATFNQLVPARGFHEAARTHNHINLLELGAVRLGLLSFVDLLKDPPTLVRLKTDSQVVMHVVNNGSSKSRAVMRELRRLHAVCDSMGVSLRAEYPPSAVNKWADSLSRARDSTDWSLSDAGFARLEAQWRPHTLDLFASAENAKCGGFFSQNAAPGSSGVDAMNLSWLGENCWCNPPFNLLGPVMHKIVTTGARVTLVAPRWEAQPWWAAAMEASSEWLPLPASEGVFTHGNREPSVRQRRWNVVAFRFGGDGATRCRATSAGGY